MEQIERAPISFLPRMIAGIALIVLGVGFIISQNLDLSFLADWWPLFILAPGIAFFAMMLLSGEKGGALAIPGSMVSTLGVVLLYQNLTGDWASWSYAWALIAPGSVGVGLYLFGRWSHIDSLRPVGLGLMIAGVVLFFGAAAFFEVLLHIGGAGEVIGRVFWPAFLILSGAVIMFSPWIRRDK